MQLKDGLECVLVPAIKKIFRDDFYRGVCIADIIGQRITTSAWHGTFTVNPPSRSRIKAQIFYYLWAREIVRAFRGSKRNIPDNIPKGRIAIEVCGGSERLKKFWEPVAIRLGPKECVVLTTRYLNPNCVPTGFDSIDLANTPINWRYCRSWIRRRLKTWKQYLQRLVDELGLEPVSVEIIIIIILIQVIRLEESRNLVDVLAPKCVLTIWDQDSIGGPICAVSRKCGIPSFTLVHGAIGRQSMWEYVPLNAEYVLVWGDLQKKLFLDAGIEESRVLIAGCQRCSKGPLPEKNKCKLLRETLGFNNRQRLVVIAFTMLSMLHKDIFKDAVILLHELLKETQFLCRLHPSSRISDFTFKYNECSRLRVIESGVLSIEETLGIADLVVVDSSTFGFDALLHGKCVAVLDPYSTPKRQDVMMEVVEYGAALYARSSSELAKKIDHVWSDDAQKSKLLMKASAFAKYYIAAYGDEATERIVNLVKEKMGDSESTGVGQEAGTGV